MGKNSVFATHIQHIENIKKITEVLPAPHRGQTIHFVYTCTLTFHTS